MSNNNFSRVIYKEQIHLVKSSTGTNIFVKPTILTVTSWSLYQRTSSARGRNAAR